MLFKKVFLLLLLVLALSSTSTLAGKHKDKHRRHKNKNKHKHHHNDGAVRHVYNGGSNNNPNKHKNKHRPGSDKDHILNLASTFADSTESLELHISDGNDKIITQDGVFTVAGDVLANDGIWLNKRKFTVYVPKWSGWWVGKIIFDKADNVRGMKSMFVRTDGRSDNPPKEVYLNQPQREEIGYLLYTKRRDGGKRGERRNVVINSDDEETRQNEENSAQCKDNKKHRKNGNKHKKQNKQTKQKNHGKNGKKGKHGKHGKHGRHGRHGKWCGGWLKTVLVMMCVDAIFAILICCVVCAYWQQIVARLACIDIKLDLERKEFKVNWKRLESKDSKDSKELKEKENKQENFEEMIRKLSMENETIGRDNGAHGEVSQETDETNDDDDVAVMESTVCTKGGKMVNTDDGVTAGEM